MMDYIKRYDWVEFDYKGENYRGEVRRVLDKPKGKMMIVKIGFMSTIYCCMERSYRETILIGIKITVR